jgi:hypothetical protein
LRFDVHRCLSSVLLRAAHLDLVEITIVSKHHANSKYSQSGQQQFSTEAWKRKTYKLM